MLEKPFLEKLLRHGLRKDFVIKLIKTLPGGCINHAVKVECEREVFFVKWNKPAFFKMFESEAKGLSLLKETGTFFIPEVLAFGCTEECSFIILEYVNSGPPDKKYWSDFGSALSKMHRATQSWFGLAYDNYIGTLPQLNSKAQNWVSFFINRRLEPQIKMAKDAALIGKKVVDDFNTLFNKIPNLIHEEFPSLLHGDLWIGNVMTSSQGKACLIDPAVYYGHREMELAFTLLFGGFDKEFYNSYFENFPVEAGFEERSEIYNLYPLMVHLNLFGGGYLNQMVQVLRKYT